MTKSPDVSSDSPSQMPPPSLNTLHHTHSTSSRSRRSSFQPFPPLSPSASSESNMPTRHPRPLTAGELHQELEKEQEAMVNKLTRELSALRAHSASVASTTSTTSNAPFVLDSTDPNSYTHPLPLATGPTHPSGSRANRSSSNASSTVPLGRSASNSISMGGGNMPVTARFEDVAHHRHELEAAKRENEQLKRRVMELETRLRERRSSSAAASP